MVVQISLVGIFLFRQMLWPLPNRDKTGQIPRSILYVSCRTIAEHWPPVAPGCASPTELVLEA